MGYGKSKTEGGHRRGHSNTAHWVTHDEVKVSTRKQRRLASTVLERNATKEAKQMPRVPGTRRGGF
jgi:hypothetical protein